MMLLGDRKCPKCGVEIKEEAFADDSSIYWEDELDWECPECGTRLLLTIGNLRADISVVLWTSDG